MRAVGILEHGTPDVLEVIDRPIPDPGPGQVRLRVVAAAVNPTDLMLRAGLLTPWMRGLEPPYVPGMDVSGVIDATGADTLFALGDRVMAFVNPFRPDGGAQAEYVVVPAEDTALVPRRLSLTDAAGLPMNGLTAHQALRRLDLPPGSTLAVTGGAGALGGFVVQLAARRGLRVVAEAAPDDEPLLKWLGAETVVPRGGDPARAYRTAVPEGVDALVDAAVIGSPALGAVRDGGQVVTCRPGDLTMERGITRHAVNVLDYPGKGKVLSRLAALAGEGAVVPRTASVLRPEEASEAHRRLEAGGVRGRQLLMFSTPSAT
ncbi:NADP-dependent oxidoreductase [Streptomyces sodiiphilus]|uniref:NADP-dependent oxidoreductase n=1 Tax=Streptomyces sodiiphilus TaxID=226217 RepID=A0ABN2P0J2_9ACTN